MNAKSANSFEHPARTGVTSGSFDHPKGFRQISMRKPVSVQDINQLKLKKFFLIWKGEVVASQRSWRQDCSLTSPYPASNSALEQFCQLPEKRSLSSLAYELEVATNQNLIYRSFLKWISKFNERAVKRKNLYRASNHWMQATQYRVLRDWTAKVRQRREHRSLLRQVVPMRCLIRVLTQNSLVNKRLTTAFIGQELLFAPHYIRMKRLDERVLHESIDEFQFNLVRGVFGALK